MISTDEESGDLKVTRNARTLSYLSSREGSTSSRAASGSSSLGTGRQSSFASPPSSAGPFMVDSANPSSVSKSTTPLGLVDLIRQASFTVLFVVVSWFVPRYMIATETTILHKADIPYQETSAGDIILDEELNRPVVDPPTIPSAFLVWASVFLPLGITGITAWYSTHQSPLSIRYHVVHASLCGLLTAIALSEGTTQLLKLYIQRRRPNFYALCGFDKTRKVCTNSLHKVREANFSFPSGHSSLANCAMTYLVWFFLSRIISSSRLSPTVKRFLALWACVVPWGWALFVGASRLVDMWHHPSDVVAGLLLGGLASTLAYHLWFPPIWLGNTSSTPWSLMVSSGIGATTNAYSLVSAATDATGKLPSFHE